MRGRKGRGRPQRENLRWLDKLACEKHNRIGAKHEISETGETWVASTS